MNTLSKEQIEQALMTLPDWQFEDNRLKASFRFKDFQDAFAFISEVASIAEAQNHHPEWRNLYNQVDIHLQTHEAGNRVTNRDLDLAFKISDLAKDFSR